MKPSTPYWTKHLLQAAIEETKDEYLKQGYMVKTKAQVGNLTVDLVASKKGEKIYFEFKGKGIPGLPKSQLLSLQRLAAKSPTTALKLVFVSPPDQAEIEIEGIEQIIEEAIVEDLPSELDGLSSHTTVEDVTDVEFTSVNISRNFIQLSGYCMVSVALQHGSNSDLNRDEGSLSSDSFPADFELELDGAFKLKESTVNVDTSSFFR